MDFKKLNNFLRKLFSILDDQEYEKIICWDNQGENVLIKDPIKMEIEIVPKFFALKKMDSFVRQLHLYDFHKNKSKSKNGTHAFYNRLFTKWDRELARQIIRKRKTRKAEMLACSIRAQLENAHESKESIPGRTDEQNLSVDSLNPDYLSVDYLTECKFLSQSNDLSKIFDILEEN